MEVFSNCTGLTSITIPESVIVIGRGAFEGCTGLTSINIPDSVTMIDENAFRFCRGLTSVVIPASVARIGGAAFAHCTGLTDIVIPESVTDIDDTSKGVYFSPDNEKFFEMLFSKTFDTDAMIDLCERNCCQTFIAEDAHLFADVHAIDEARLRISELVRYFRTIQKNWIDYVLRKDYVEFTLYEYDMIIL
jgi:hypothetical protein